MSDVETMRAWAEDYKAQRDELLALLEAVVKDPTLALSAPVNHITFNEDGTTSEHREKGHPWWHQARAAVKKARGES
jgi:hypothetical protein